MVLMPFIPEKLKVVFHYVGFACTDGEDVIKNCLELRLAQDATYQLVP